MGLGEALGPKLVRRVILSPASVDQASVTPPLTPCHAGFLFLFSLGPSWAERVNFDASEQAWRGSMQIHTLS